MSENEANYLQTSLGNTTCMSAEESQTSADSTFELTHVPALDTPTIDMARYPCCGNVELKSYVDMRIYSFSFRRLHDEWVALGGPRLNTEHWPRMAGHRGLPTSPEDFIKVAEYYDRKLFAQVQLDSQGKPANRERPLDDFLVSMVTTAAVIDSDLVVYRLLCEQPSLEEAAVQSAWHQHFTTFMHDCVRILCNQRRACAHLGPHNCILPLLFGQAASMSLPTLLRTFDYQVQIFQNLFPNFGEHISRCAAAQTSQAWNLSSRVTGGGHPGGAELSVAREAPSEHRHAGTRPVQIHNKDDKGHSVAIEFVGVGQQALNSPRRTYVDPMPTENTRRIGLYVSHVESAIRSDVPPEREVSLIDSGGASSTSASTSSASTPLPATTHTPSHVPQISSGVPSRSYLPFSEAPLSAQRREQDENLSMADSGEDLWASNLSLRPPQQSQSRRLGVSHGSPSEEYAVTTPEEGMSTPQGRASAFSYFSSLPTTPSGHVSPTPLGTTQQDSQAKPDRRTHRSNTGVLPMLSFSSDSESRKRTRAEQNREKMKAYHKRVMQQREALTNVLTEMAANVGTISLSWPSTRTPFVLGPEMANSRTSTDLAGSNFTPGIASPIRRSTQEPTWSASLRNKQKQESKARLRRREIDQVHELGLYASYATASLSQPVGPGSPAPTSGSGYPGSVAIPTANDQSELGTGVWQVDTQPGAVKDSYKSHAILGVFLRHRPNWTALISAEQRLANEVAKLTPDPEERNAVAEGPGVRDNVASGFGNRRIKTLLDLIQAKEKKGTLDPALREPSTVLAGPSIFAQQGLLAGENAGTRSMETSMGSAGAKASRLSLQQHSPSQLAYFQAESVGSSALILSPDGSESGTAATPSGVTRPSRADEGVDYFNLEPRRHGGRAAGSSEVEASLLSDYMPPAYTAEQASMQVAHLTPAGTPTIANAASAIPPSVVSPKYGSQLEAVYSDGEATQPNRGLPETQWRVQGSMAGMQQSPSAPAPMQELQLPMSTPFDGRNYGQPGLQSATTKPLEQAPGTYQSQSLQPQAYHQYEYAPSQASGQVQAHLQSETDLYDSIVTSTSMDAYRANQPPSPQVPRHHQQPRGQQNPYRGP